MRGFCEEFGEKQDLKIDFHPLRTRFRLGGREVLAVHGDGLTEEHWSATVMYHLTKNPLVIAGFRALHPSMTFWLADRMSHGLGNTTRDPARLDQAALRQQAWAERELGRDPGLGLVVMGHTHRPALREIAPGRHYVNPGAWMDGFGYAVATEATIELKRWAR